MVIVYISNEISFKFYFRKVAAAFRVVAGRKSVEKGLDKKLHQLNHKLDHLFVKKEVTIKVKPPKDEQLEEEPEVDERGYQDKTSVGVRTYFIHSDKS